ncbi:hypothetical protein DACRYDRAFT_112938 [Dacryopinax primogenitus]|uniref:Uncharacterized protein n=1 Tax=Dacryopinax primogenitus (strain DJM 731) TaxID=1858805 RepID=M5G7M5_DACPD|nr:uncharacterized protein DACRYDRAFT_112938 [Dacryopinax primogenitus]EJU06186.1 hypothetical protein DACRYDRAFT_112938 [Dacryopinax primogenitus]
MPPKSRATSRPVEVPDEAPPTASMFDPDRQSAPRTPAQASRTLTGAGIPAVTSTPANFIPDTSDNSFRSAILSASQLNLTPQRPGFSAPSAVDLITQSPIPSSDSHDTIQERASYGPGAQKTPVKPRGIMIREDPSMVSSFDPKDEVLYKLWVD